MAKGWGVGAREMLSRCPSDRAGRQRPDNEADSRSATAAKWRHCQIRAARLLADEQQRRRRQPSPGTQTTLLFPRLYAHPLLQSRHHRVETTDGRTDSGHLGALPTIRRSISQWLSNGLTCISRRSAGEEVLQRQRNTFPDEWAAIYMSSKYCWIAHASGPELSTSAQPTVTWKLLKCRFISQWADDRRVYCIYCMRNI